MTMILGKARQYATLLRPWQWVKNAFVLSSLFFAEKLGDPYAVEISLLLLAAFCLASGSVYALNDVFDRKRDRLHPLKRGRPVASGAVSVLEALVLAVAAGAGGMLLAWRAGAPLTVGGYVLLQVAYGAFLKHVVILDVLVIAIGFVLRVAAGGEALGIEISSWLILCTFLLALFLATTKRRQEIASLAPNTAEGRPVLDRYSLPFLDQMISVVTPGVILAYAIYTISPVTVEKFGTNALVWTVPLVVYGVFRYLYLVYRKGRASDPTQVLFRDAALAADVVLWVLACGLIIYFG
jgi:4-hydroxybenzoate polyprenyltransferase